MFLSALLTVASVQPHLAMANLPAENPALGTILSVGEVEAKIAQVTDRMLRDALTELLRSAVDHTPPVQGVGDPEEVMRICRSSQRVFCNFLGMQATSTVQTVKLNKVVIKHVYAFVFGKIEWITAREIKHSDLVNCVVSIKEKYHKMGLDVLTDLVNSTQGKSVTSR